MIAGTATKAGKSTLVAALKAYWQRHSPQPLSWFNPAADSDEREAWLDLAQVWQQLGELSERDASSLPSVKTTLLELPGGLGTPVTPEVTVADLAWDWRLPTVLVVPAEAGMVGQAIAHVALARQARVHLKGIVINHRSADVEGEDGTSGLVDASGGESEAALIQSLTQIPVLGVLPYFADTTDDVALADAAARLDLERLFPLPALASMLAIAS